MYRSFISWEGSIMTGSSERVAIVTGGSGGIGRASALRLAADETAVVVHYRGNAARAEEVVRAITDAGGRALAVGGDVADEEQAAALFDTAERELGGVDVLVHHRGHHAARADRRPRPRGLRRGAAGQRPRHG